jgi:hypothetical protein
MGLMDKVKAAAEKAATEAKKGTAQVKEKIGDAQLRRKADDAAKRLGYLVVKEGTAAGAEADALVAEIKDLEAKVAEETSESPAGAVESEPQEPATGSASEAAPGDFKLE